MLENFKTQAAFDRLNEEEIYAKVIREIESGLRRDGVWAKCIANSGGDLEKAKAMYINLRVQSIRDEIQIEKSISRAEKNRIQQQKEDNACLAAATAAQHKNQTNENTRKYFKCYDQPFIYKTLGFIFKVACSTFLIVAVTLLIYSITDNTINGWYILLIFFAAAVSLFGQVVFAPTKAIVVCPVCQSQNRVPANTHMNCHCGKCEHQFEIQT